MCWCSGGQVDAVVFATGTGGTLAGVSMFLKSKNPNIKTVLADPDVSVNIISVTVIHQCILFKIHITNIPVCLLVLGTIM